MKEKIINYIEDLEGYEQEYYKTSRKVEILQQRIDKAIEYINEHSTNSYFSMLQADYNMSLDELLEILGDKE